MSIHKHRSPSRGNRRKVKQALGNNSLKDVSPLTKTQEDVFYSYNEGQNLILHGVAGTGKTYLSLYLALQDLEAGITEKVVIVRSVVSSREIGHLPGSLQEKTVVYEQPYREIVSDLLQRGDAYDILKRNNQVVFLTSSFVRGITLDNSIVVIDEIQNMNDQEINSILTRIGRNTRVIICGDYRQSDLENQRRKEVSGLANMMKIGAKMKSFDIIEFQVKDIVRSGFVKEYLVARMNLSLDTTS